MVKIKVIVIISIISPWDSQMGTTHVAYFAIVHESE